jgi:hypothetical protein
MPDWPDHARQGKKVLVLTLLGESHAKMINHFRSFSFLDDALIGNEIVFFSAYTSLAKGSLKDLLQLIISSISDEHPNILVIDGLRSIRNSSATDVAHTEFMHSLKSLVSSIGTYAPSVRAPAIVNLVFGADMVLQRAVVDEARQRMLDHGGLMPVCQD